MGIIQILLFAFCALLAHNVHANCVTSNNFDEAYSVRANSQFSHANSNGWYCTNNACGSMDVPRCVTAAICSQGIIQRSWPDNDYITDCDGCQSWADDLGSSCSGIGGNAWIVVRCKTRCTTECEAKKAMCDNSGGVFDSTTCECGAPPLPTKPCSYCEEYVDNSAFPPIKKSRNYRCTITANRAV